MFNQARAAAMNHQPYGTQSAPASRLDQQTDLIRQSMKTPRAAAIAGIIFSLLLMTSQVLIWLSVPPDPTAAATEIVRHSKEVVLALNLLPFAGIAFLWFIAVVRDRLGDLEDRFFSTVFLGSGLLYVAMIFTATAIAGAVVGLLTTEQSAGAISPVYLLGRAEIYRFTSLFGTKMSAVFMASASTIFLRTRVLPRWIAFSGYVLSAGLLLSIGIVPGIPAVFPLWVMLVSICILRQGAVIMEDVGRGTA
jgi:hypothetical protein